MTNPIHIGIGGHGGVTGTTGPFGGTMDPDRVRQIQLLAEASLVSFTATPPALTPFGKARLAWNVAMPTTVLPGVTVEVVIEGLGGDLVGNGPGGTVLAQDSITVAPFGDTTYGVALRTPLAYRELGTLSLAVDFATCNSLDLPIAAFTNAIIAAAKTQFVGNSQLKLSPGSYGRCRHQLVRPVDPARSGSARLAQRKRRCDSGVFDQRAAQRLARRDARHRERLGVPRAALDDPERGLRHGGRRCL